MRAEFYLYASGTESDIRALYEHVKLPGSEIKALRFPSSPDQPHQGFEWMWCSPSQECASDFPEDELTAFLHDNADLFQQLQAHRDVLHDLAGIIVCYLDEDEQPHGYSISPSLMRLLADANASLEIDIVPLIPTHGL